MRRSGLIRFHQVWCLSLWPRVVTSLPDLHSPLCLCWEVSELRSVDANAICACIVCVVRSVTSFSNTNKFNTSSPSGAQYPPCTPGARRVAVPTGWKPSPVIGRLPCSVAVLDLYRYGSFWLIKPKACTNQKVVRDTSCLTEIKASRSAFLVAKSAKSAKYRVFCGYT